MCSSSSIPNFAFMFACRASARSSFKVPSALGAGASRVSEALAKTPFCARRDICTASQGSYRVARHDHMYAKASAVTPSAALNECPDSPDTFTERVCGMGTSLATNATLVNTFHVQEQLSPVAPTSLSTLADDMRLGGRDIVHQSYIEKFVIRCYEAGMNGTASPETMANLLQEVACNHAQSVGFSTDGFSTTPLMRKRRLIWVTTRMHIEVNEYPSWGDVIQIETWCQSEGKVGTRRDWLLTNVATGEVIGRATSTWVMMNQDTRRLSRITDDVRDEYMQYCPVQPRYAFPEENSSSLKKIPKLDDPAQHMIYGLMPRRGDLDMNQHVNNVTYIGWILESVPHKVLDTHQLHRITLDYRRECNYGDTVESLASLEIDVMTSNVPTSNVNGTVINGSTHGFLDEFEFLHILRLAGCHTEINRGRTVWRAKPKKYQSGQDN